MNKTKIDWADMSWNPVTGCYHECPYCYARRIARRFGTLEKNRSLCSDDIKKAIAEKHFLAILNGRFPGEPYPYDFLPTFHRYRLDKPKETKKPQNIFIGSMADLFGEWVPDEWIQEVFNACVAAPQHTYIFLTKNPDRYWQVNSDDDDTKSLNIYGVPVLFGASTTNNEQLRKAYKSPVHWISVEPLHEELNTEECFSETRRGDDAEVPRWSWVVIGAETGDREGKIVPQRKWIEAIVETCRYWEIPVFMKKNLADIWREPLIQEYPWEEEETTFDEEFPKMEEYKKAIDGCECDCGHCSVQCPDVIQEYLAWKKRVEGEKECS